MRTSIKIFIFCLTSLVFIGCDRVTKDLAKEHLMNKAAISYFHNSFRLSYVENTGAAMSVGDELSTTTGFWLLCVLPLIFLLFLTGYVIRNSKEMSLMKICSFSLIISGGLGNIIDRILFNRHVTDFMNIGVDDLRTGIFNFADVCVTAGAIGLLIFYNKNRAQVNTQHKPVKHTS